jgi:cell division protein FtsL
MVDPQTLAAGDALVRVRRERIHTSMLIELLVLLVFLAMAFAFVRDSEKRFDRLQDKLNETQNKLDDAQREILKLNQEKRVLIVANRALSASLRRYIEGHTGTLRANDQMVTIPQTELEKQSGRLSEVEKMLVELQAENGALRAKMAASGHGGTDLPRCTVAAGSFIVRVDALAGGDFSVKPMWAEAASAKVSEVPGLVELASNRPISGAKFRQLAGQVQAWGKAQSIPCGFSAVVHNQHSQLELYKRQYQVVSAFFYTAMR